MQAIRKSADGFFRYNTDVIEDILKEYTESLGDDYHPYLNHARRVYEYTCILTLQKESKKLAITAAFHDLDIWLNRSMDYLPGSAMLAADHINKKNIDLLSDEIAFIIKYHHKLTRIRGNIEAEAFRKADLIDLSAGWIRFNLPKSIIMDAESRFPRLGFTGLVTRKTLQWALRHPWNPFPMIRI